MKAILVTCPHCGARVQVQGSSDTTTCDYCGTVARVQRRTRMFQTVLPLPPSAPGRPVQVAVQHRSRMVVPIMVLTLALPIVITAMIFRFVNKTIDRATSGVSSAMRPGPVDDPKWDGTSGAIIVDINGDGALDLIGRSRRVQAGDVVRVVAIDGRSGKPLWESDAVGAFSDIHQGTLTLAGDLVVFASPRAKLQAFEVATGQARWTATLDERVARFCDGGAETIVALGTDQVARPLRRVDGTPATTDAERPSAPPAARPRSKRDAPVCEALPTDQDSRRRRHDQDASTLGRAHGLNADLVVGGPGLRVLSGTRSKGTRVATLVAIDDAGAERWRVAVPKDPLGSIERAPELVNAGERDVCVGYYETSVAKPMRLACFALEDGTRRWDVVTSGRHLRLLQFVGRMVVLGAPGAGLQARDLDTGAVRWTFGG